MASGGSNGSQPRVVVDSIDVNLLVTNVFVHLLRRNLQVSDNQLETAGVPVHTLDNSGGGEESDTHVPDGPGSGNGEDQSDYPGESLTQLDVEAKKITLKQITARLVDVADDVDKDKQLLALIQALDIRQDTAYETFATIATGIFLEGRSWGKIVALFVFGAKCVVRAIVNKVENSVWKVANFVARFIGAELTEWICSAGGWGSLVKSPSLPALRMGTVIVVSLVLGAILKTLWDGRFTSFRDVSRTRIGFGIIQDFL